MTLEKYSIKPSASIIATIGSEIIKDPLAAIIELVKNSYDADADKVCITFKELKNDTTSSSLKIIIKDTGHGMSPEIVKSTWLVPATKNKFRSKCSPSGRLYLGRKGIGRYASSILGNNFKLETIDSSGMKTTVKLCWSDFNNYDFLDEVPILIEESQTTEYSGTTIEIISETFDTSLWNEKNFFKLIKELMLLVSPLENKLIKNVLSELPFDIFLTIDVNDYPHKCENVKIEPFALYDFYNYRLYGTIYGDGKTDLTYENTSGTTIQSEKIKDIIPLPMDKSHSYCGNIYIDFRVFDRDSSDIQAISEKTKSLYNNFYFGKLQTRQLLNELSGVKLYRNNFRIRPYGESDNDWLNLDKERVQNPSARIGNNQICGQVIIDSEEDSGLIESSSREGLKENSNYKGLLHILKEALKQIESRRLAYRKSSGKGRTQKKISDIIDNIPDFRQLTCDIDQLIKSNDSSENKASKVIDIFTQVENKTRETILELQEIIAKYQGQATLGKIVMVVLHEGRKPIQWINSNDTILKQCEKILSDDPNNTFAINNILKITSDTYKATNMLSTLFDKIEPLSIKSKRKISIFNISEVIEKALNIFSLELKNSNIEVEYNKEDISFSGYQEDIISTFANLIENSIYWLTAYNKQNPKIKIDIYNHPENIEIIYQDNGPGIKKQFIESQIIFEPDFSTKIKGTGIGLAICGESITRNNGIIEAIYSDSGALFSIKLTKEKENENS